MQPLGPSFKTNIGANRPVAAPITDSGFKHLAGRIRSFTRGERSQRLQAACDAGALDGEIPQLLHDLDAMADRMNLALARQNLHESLIANSTDAIISKTLQGIVTGWNPAATEIFGYTEAEMIGESILILIPEDRRGEEDEILCKISQGERLKNYQTLRRRKNGEIFPVSVTLSPIRDTVGAIIGASKIARDITEAVNTAQALKRAEERYELVLQGTNLGIWEWDLSTDNMYWSARLRAIVGSLPGNEVENYDRFMALLHPDDRWEVEDRLRAHLDRREPLDMEYRLLGKEGAYAWIHATGQAIWDNQGKPIRVAGSVEDITDRTQLQFKLQETVDKLRKSNKDLDEFAFAASHDLKAPLRVIDNTSQWLMEDLEPWLTSETRENMALLRSRVTRMKKLLSDLLEYAQIGKSPDERYGDQVKGSELLENIVTLLSPKAGFTVRADAGFAKLTVPRMPLQQVLMNLVDNAIKHHDKAEGRVEIGLRDAGSMLLISVSDDGPGVPAQFHEKIFEVFRTLKPRDQVEGSGIGLAMVRKNVEMFGGAIKLHSSPGQGCQFRFTWPKSPQEMP